MSRRKDPWDAAEAVFKPARAKPAAPVPARPAIPGARELVSIRLDQDVLDYFQADGPGWQERINDALRSAAKLDGADPETSEETGQ